jgi:hypothetical protein
MLRSWFAVEEPPEELRFHLERLLEMLASEPVCLASGLCWRRRHLTWGLVGCVAAEGQNDPGRE